MNQNSEKKPFSTDMPANSIPETNFQPDYNWTASQSAPLVTVSQEEWNEWMRKNMEYRASLNLSGDKHPPKTFTDPSDSHLQDSLKGMGDFYPQDPSTDPEDSHHQEPTSEPGTSHLQDPFFKSGTEKFSESGRTGLGQPDSVSPELPQSPQSSDEEERSGLSKGVTLLLALIVIQLVIILIILCRKKGIILEDAESVFAFFPNVHHISYYPFSAIREIIS